MTGIAGGPLPLLLPLCAIGGGAGVTTPSMSLAVLDAAERKRSGLASGILNSARQTGVVVGAALLGALFGDPASLGGACAAVLATTAAFACACTVAIAIAIARRHGASLWR